LLRRRAGSKNNVVALRLAHTCDEFKAAAHHVIHMLDIRKSGFCITNLGHFFGRYLLSVDDRVSFLINLLFSASVTYRLSADVPEMAIRFDLM
jgi:hypothetical protein